jgi:broad specificity phosphatase PhoE
MPRSIYFVTHPDVVIDPAVPVPRWPLSERGQRRMRSLLSQTWLAEVEAIYCSTEQKAIDGAVILSAATGVPFHLVAALGENDRSATGYLPPAEFEATVVTFFAHPSVSVRGWERAEVAQARIVRAVTDIAHAASGAGPIVVVSHGGVGALLLCHLQGQPISRTAEQPGKSGGNYFLFQMPESVLVHGWKPIDA